MIDTVNHAMICQTRRHRINAAISSISRPALSVRSFVPLFTILCLFLFHRPTPAVGSGVNNIAQSACPPAKTPAGYRVGDMFRDPYWRSASDTGQQFHYEYFPESIASEYMRRTPESKRFDILQSIIDEYKSNLSPSEVLPDSRTLTIHLRIGDVVDEMCLDVETMLDDFTPWFSGLFYVRPRRYYEEIIQQIEKSPLTHPISSIRSVVLVGGYHREGAHEKSIEYVHAIQQLFTRHGFNVTTRIDCDADSDLIFMSSSRFFLPSGGGYSNMTAELIRRDNGTILVSNLTIPTERLPQSYIEQLCGADYPFPWVQHGKSTWSIKLMLLIVVGGFAAIAYKYLRSYLNAPKPYSLLPLAHDIDQESSNDIDDTMREVELRNVESR